MRRSARTLAVRYFVFAVREAKRQPPNTLRALMWWRAAFNFASAAWL